VDRCGKVEDEPSTSVDLWDDGKARDLGAWRKTRVPELGKGNNPDKAGISLVADIFPDQADVFGRLGTDMRAHRQRGIDGGWRPVRPALRRDAGMTIVVEDLVEVGREEALCQRLRAK
jgi:hypothetical protein